MFERLFEGRGSRCGRGGVGGTGFAIGFCTMEDTFMEGRANLLKFVILL
jgi:hypothetical protein